MTNNNVSQTSTYRSVAILKPGVFIDASDRSVRFTDDDLRRVAENYDPAYHLAALNIDHAPDGPALGQVLDLVWDGEYLRADLGGVPVELSGALDAGRYPGRSAEVYADLDGRGPYLRAVALLGARPPAVKGLPPFPPPVGDAHGRPAGGPWAAPTQAPRPIPIILTTFLEVPMPAKPVAAAFVLSEAIPPPLEAVTPTHVPALSAEPVGTDGQGRRSSLETIRLAEENRRLQEDAVQLAEENRSLKVAQQRREVRLFLGRLRQSGQLTPALERCGVEQVLLFAEEQPYSVAWPDGDSAPLASVLRELLSALPVSFSLGEAAPAAAAIPAAPALSADDQAVMAALGLSAAEYVRS